MKISDFQVKKKSEKFFQVVNILNKCSNCKYSERDNTKWQCFTRTLTKHSEV